MKGFMETPETLDYRGKTCYWRCATRTSRQRRHRRHRVEGRGRRERERDGVFKALRVLDEVGKHKIDMGLDTRTEISK